jgi:hypothetical protein
MQHFVDTIIKPYVVRNRYRRVCEIGASQGEITDKLSQVDSIDITIVDPCWDADLCEKYRSNKKIHVQKGMSLQVLPQISQPFDCILIDGDHNWFTVYNELRTLEQRALLKEGGTIFLHDVTWPYGRRDMYYQPELVPEQFRQPCAKKGIRYGQSGLSNTTGLNAHFYNAVQEGGARNGVLTAIEDFLGSSEINYRFFYIRQEFGLGVLLKPGSQTSSVAFEILHFRAVLIGLWRASRRSVAAALRKLGLRS